MCKISGCWGVGYMVVRVIGRLTCLWSENVRWRPCNLRKMRDYLARFLALWSKAETSSSLLNGTTHS
jgi:hypothetical protein